MNFLFPSALWLTLIVPILIGLYVWAQRRRQKYALRYASLSLVKEALGRGPGIRRHIPPALFLISLVVNVGMWLERFVIIVTSLHRDFLPSSWGMYQPTFWDWSTFFGTIGLFLSLLFLFLRFLPMISIFEMRTILPEAKVNE